MYKRIRISKTKTRDRHRIIMEEELGRPLLSSELVHHKNEKRDDDRIDNFKLTNRGDHARHHMTGRKLKETTKKKLRECPHLYGQQHPSSKLSNNNVFEIRSMLAAGVSERYIASEFSVSKTTIHRIKTQETWGRVA